MSQLVRFGVSIEDRLLDDFDRKIVAAGYGNRSEAIRDLIRARLVELQWEAGSEETVATLTLVYDHDVREIEHKLTDFQHSFHQCVLAATHVHLDPHSCLEVIILKGPAATLKTLADGLVGIKGVRHGRLTMTTTARDFPHAHEREKRHRHAHGQ